MTSPSLLSLLICSLLLHSNIRKKKKSVNSEVMVLANKFFSCLSTMLQVTDLSKKWSGTFPKVLFSRLMCFEWGSIAILPKQYSPQQCLFLPLKVQYSVTNAGSGVFLSCHECTQRKKYKASLTTEAFVTNIIKSPTFYNFLSERSIFISFLVVFVLFCFLLFASSKTSGYCCLLNTFS